MDNQVVTLPVDSPKLKFEGASNVEFRADAMQQAFAAEAAPKYRKTVEQFAHFYDSRYNYGGGPVRPPEWEKAMSDLAELDSQCRTRYKGVRDFQGITYIQEGSVDYRYSVWCDIAAKRNQLEPVVRAGIVKTLVNLGYTEENLNFGFNEPDNPLRTEIQQMIWEPAKWRAAKMAELKPRYAKYNVGVPPDATAEAEKRAGQLKEMVMRDAPSRSYKQPPYHDAAVESVVRSQFAKEYPGVQVVKIGLDYRTWVQRKSLDYIASDEIFRYYRVSYNVYKRGTALLKIPGRPFCQLQDWVVGRGASGIVPAGIGGSGTFMKCD